MTLDEAGTAHVVVVAGLGCVPDRLGCVVDIDQRCHLVGVWFGAEYVSACGWYHPRHVTAVEEERCPWVR